MRAFDEPRTSPLESGLAGRIAVATLLLLLFGSFHHTYAQEQPVNPDAAILQDFEKRVNEFMKLRKTAESSLPKLKQTPSQAEIKSHEGGLAQAIHEARKQARQGDIFTPEIGAEFRRLIKIAMQGQDKTRIK